MLVSDGVYDPTRSFCDGFLRRFGVSTSYFPPSATADELAALFQVPYRTPRRLLCVAHKPQTANRC